MAFDAATARLCKGWGREKKHGLVVMVGWWQRLRFARKGKGEKGQQSLREEEGFFFCGARGRCSI